VVSDESGVWGSNYTFNITIDGTSIGSILWILASNTDK
jgi:hypothetical protein